MDHNVLFQQLISSSPPHSHMDIAKIDFKVKIKPPMKMSTATKGKRPMRHLTASDKIEAIQRIHDGESKASVARDIGVPESTLRGWCKNEDKLRYMSRQSTPDSKMDKLTEDAVAAGLLGQLGPPEKRPKMDTSLPLNFATNGGKLKYDDLGPYKSRPSLNGLDLSSNSDLNGLSHSDFSAFAKSAKGYGADLSKPQDPTKGDMSMAAISPLTSLSHLSGMSSLGQSPLALSFNEIATNLNLIAQFNNPNLAAMSGLNQLNTSTQSLRNVRPKTTSVGSNLSPRSNNNNNNNTIDQDKLNQGLTVKNLSKLQKNDPMGLNLSEKNKKLQTQIPTINRDAPVDDALWYWLKSQQAMLGLNNLYSSITQQNNNNNNNNMSSNNNLNSSSSTLLNSPQSNISGHHMHHQTPPQPQQQQMQQPPPQHHPSQTPTPPIVSSPQITPPSSTPSAASDDTKNSSWFWQWYKTFGSSLLDKQNTINNNNQMNNNNGKIPSYENILYSQLTKGAPLSDSLVINNNNNITNLNNNNLPKPEDLSQHSNNNINNMNNNINNNNSHIISNSHNISHNNSLNISNDNLSLNTSHNNHLNHNGSHIDDDNHSDHDNGHEVEMNNSENNIPNDLSSSSSIKREDLEKSPGKVRAVLDDLLFNNNTSNTNNNNNNNNNINNSNSSNSSNLLIESNDNINNNIINNSNNNNNNDIKSESDSDSEISSPLEAVEHGEKFLKWLETYSDPSVTAMQVMQFRYLLNTIKTSADRANNPTPVNEERIKIRRRK